MYTKLCQLCFNSGISAKALSETRNYTHAVCYRLKNPVHQSPRLQLQLRLESGLIQDQTNMTGQCQPPVL